MARTTQIKVTGNVTEAVAALEHLGVKAETVAKETEGHFKHVAEGVGGAFGKLGSIGESWNVPFAGALSALSEKMEKLKTDGASLRERMNTVGNGIATALGGAAAVVGAEGLKLAANYQQATAKIAASSGVSVDAANKIGAAFLKTGFQSTFSAQEMADAYGQVAGQLKATEGHALNVAEATDVMKAATDLAEASNGDLNSTTAALAGTMQAYGLKTKDAAKATDVLYNVSRSTNIPVTDLASVFDRLKGRLGVLAPSLEDVGTLMEFPAVAAQGSRGAMVVNTALTTLLGGSKNVNKELKTLGVSLYDQHGKFVGLRSVIEQLQPRLDHMSQSQQIAAEKTLFGSSAAQLMAQILMGGLPAYDAAKARATQLGTAQAAAEKQSSTFHGETEKLKAGLEDLGVKVGEWLIPKLDGLAHMTEKVIGWFDKHKGAAKALAITFESVLGVAVAAFTVNKLAGLASGIRGAITNIGKMGTALQTLATRFLGVGTAATTMATETEAANKAALRSTASTDTAIEGDNTAAAGSYAERGAGGAAGGLGAGAGAISGMFGPLGAIAGVTYAAHASGHSGPVIGLESGGTAGAKGYDLSKSDYIKSLTKALDANRDATGATVEAWIKAQATQTMFSDAMQVSHVSVGQLTDALEGGRVSTDLLSQEMMHNKYVQEDGLQPAVQAMFGAWNQVSGSAGKYNSILASIPRNVGTKVTLDASQAMAAVANLGNGFQQLVNNLNSKVRVGVGGSRQGTAYATGGWVTGAGTHTSDSVNARLSNGEYVLSDAMLTGNAPVDPRVRQAITGGAGGGSGATVHVGGVQIIAQTNASATGIANELNWALRPYMAGA